MKINTNKAKKHVRKISRRLILALILIILILVVIFQTLFSMANENSISIGHLSVVQLSQSVEYYLIEDIDEIAIASQTVDVLQNTGKSNEDILKYLTLETEVISSSIDEGYTGLYGYINGEYMDGTGWVPEDGYNPVERPWYIEAYEGKGNIVFVSPYLDSLTGTVMMSLSKLLPDGKSVVSLDISLDNIQHIIANAYDEYDSAFIIDKDNIIVAASNIELLGTNASDSLIVRQYYSNKQDADDAGYYRMTDNEGDVYYIFTSSVNGQWRVFLSEKQSDMMSSTYHIYSVIILGIISFIAFIVLYMDDANKKHKAAENLINQLESIADIYISVHKFDLEKDTIEEVRSLQYVHDQALIAEKTSQTSQEVLTNVLKELVREEYWESVAEFIDFSTLDKRAEGTNTISLEFLGIHGWTKARIIILERDDDKIKSFLWMVENINEEKKKQSELRYLSETDLMTGIRNRGCGEKLIKELLALNKTGMFCVMDADHFKSINDNYGHDVGDRVIKAVANALSASFRSSDIVLRLGGDEFAAFAVGIENESQSRDVLDRFVNAISNIVIPEFDGNREVEISIGVSFINSYDTKPFRTLYREADKATYESKKVQGTCITYYSLGME